MASASGATNNAYANRNSGPYPNPGNYPNSDNQYGGGYGTNSRQHQYGSGYQDKRATSGYNKTTGFQGSFQGSEFQGMPFGPSGFQTMPSAPGYQGNNRGPRSQGKNNDPGYQGAGFQNNYYQGNYQNGVNQYGFSNNTANYGKSSERGSSGYNRGAGRGQGVKRNYNGSWKSGGDGILGNYEDQWGWQSGGGGHDYNTNPEWYNNGYNGKRSESRGRGGFQGRKPGWGPNAPYRPEGSYNRVWQKGMPRLEDKEKEKAGEKKMSKSQKKKHSMMRVAKFKDMMSLKNKYRSVRQNKFLTNDEQLVLVFLKRVAYDMCNPDHMVHCINFSKLASRHPNALKLFTYEAKIHMDRKYDSSEDGSIEKRKQYLKEAKEDVISGFKKVYKQRAATEDFTAREEMIDRAIDILSGEKFTDADVPTGEDYLFDKNHSRREEDFVKEFKHDFVFNCYEVFKFKPDEKKAPTKDIGKRLKFHLENSVIPFLLVESVRGKKLVTSLPEPLSTYVFQQGEVHQKKNEECLDSVVALCQQTGETVVTPITRYITPGSEYSTEVFRDFADCILMFDKFATYIKYRLLKYSPNILLPDTQKEQLYDQLVDRVYREALDILVNNKRLDAHTFVDMERDEIKVEAKEGEEAKVKVEKADTKTK